MPTYEYQCTKCDHSFEIVQKITEDSITICDKCGGRLRKLLFPVGIVFKGSGFYVTDNRRPQPISSSDGNGSNGKKDSVEKKDVAEKPKEKAADTS
jgi:putative FmdB family regulatory protein